MKIVWMDSAAEMGYVLIRVNFTMTAQQGTYVQPMVVSKMNAIMETFAHN